MFGFIKGYIDYIKEGLVCIDTGNVGYLVNISDKTYAELLNETNEVKLYTYTNVREDDISIFGFLTLDELEFYKMLINVNSIGPKSGLSLLSFYTVGELANLIANSDAKAIAKTPGVGNKSAEKIIIDLKDKISNFEQTEVERSSSSLDKEMIAECLEALMSLGFKKKEAENAISKVKNANDVSDLLSKALQYFDK